MKLKYINILFVTLTWFSCSNTDNKADLNLEDFSNKTIELTTNNSNYLINNIESRYHENHEKFEYYFNIAQAAVNAVELFDSLTTALNNKDEILSVYKNTRNVLETNMEKMNVEKDSMTNDFEFSENELTYELIRMEVHLFKNQLLQGVYSMINASDDRFYIPKVTPQTIECNYDSLTFSLESDYFQLFQKRYIKIDSILINGKLSNSIFSNSIYSKEIAKIKIETPFKGEYKIYGKVFVFPDGGDNKTIETFNYKYNKK